MATAATPTARPTDGIDPRGMRVIWLLLIAAFVAILNETTMGIAIPHLNVDLGIPPSLGQWLTSAFMLTMAVVIPITGFLLQRFTTRGVFLTAASLFCAGTLVCLVAPGFAVLLVGRVVQASGTAIMMPLLMTTVMNVIPTHSRGRIMGRAGIVMALAPAVGPTLSGLILDSLSWRWLFGLILPIAVFALLIGAKWMLNLGEPEPKHIDVLSIVLSAIGFGGLVFGLSQLGGEHQAEAALSVGTIAVITCAAVVSLGVFVWRQLLLQRRDAALLDLRVFRSVNFTVAVAVMSVLALSMFGGLTLLPLYLQNVLGLTATEAGLVVLPGSVLMGVMGPIIGRVYDARGPRPLLIPGTVLVAAALWFYTTVGQTTPVWLLVAIQTGMSFGLAMSFTPLFSSSLGSLRPRLYSHGSAVLNTLQQVAGAAGVSLLITTMSSVAGGQPAGLGEAAAQAAGVHTAFLTAAVISLVAVAGAFFVRRPPADDASAADAPAPAH
ncbi:MDR family MFS transporter [Streptomonospora nanhaiensis]|uniref:MDR family MFS transporter n=1 Tax=Streptomonospora nanhaiensis TaxID=1323731 RepID=UPI001C38CEF8|nr:MDR family MFS transporter [Streptomonospora nanhaiensis]MBV2366816.1 DHA2 family efflux MFS transporter permease subunit [Streptomonospora nanhaiensis]MBX9390934.1 DHA2 family efflux MFS transporter permease subunit [Streptomonospora nanhaiensis]